MNIEEGTGANNLSPKQFQMWLDAGGWESLIDKHDDELKRAINKEKQNRGQGLAWRQVRQYRNSAAISDLLRFSDVTVKQSYLPRLMLTISGLTYLMKLAHSILPTCRVEYCANYQIRSQGDTQNSALLTQFQATSNALKPHSPYTMQCINAGIVNTNIANLSHKAKTANQLASNGTIQMKAAADFVSQINPAHTSISENIKEWSTIYTKLVKFHGAALDMME